MIDSKDHIVNVEAWKKGFKSYPSYIKLKDEPDGKEAWKAYIRVQDEWNLRTSGAGDVYLTLLYSLRAHKRGRVHCHDFDLAQQAEFLKKAEPLLRRFLMEKEVTEQAVEAA